MSEAGRGALRSERDKSEGAGDQNAASKSSDELVAASDGRAEKRTPVSAGATIDQTDGAIIKMINYSTRSPKTAAGIIAVSFATTAAVIFLTAGGGWTKDLCPQYGMDNRQAGLNGDRENQITDKKKNRCKVMISIKAPPEIVWRIIHEERQHDPDIAYSKVLDGSENQCNLEQKFVFLPVIGSSVCIMHETETPFARIDYKLLKSDHFKAMEGSWELTPEGHGQTTTLQLISYLDLGLPVPRSWMNAITAKKMEKRLSHIKELAEQANIRLAASTRQI